MPEPKPGTLTDAELLELQKAIQKSRGTRTFGDFFPKPTARRKHTRYCAIRSGRACSCGYRGKA